MKRIGCTCCGSTGATVGRCTACNSAVYCSEECTDEHFGVHHTPEICAAVQLDDAQAVLDHHLTRGDIDAELAELLAEEYGSAQSINSWIEDLWATQAPIEVQLVRGKFSKKAKQLFTDAKDSLEKKREKRAAAKAKNTAELKQLKEELYELETEVIKKKKEIAAKERLGKRLKSALSGKTKRLNKKAKGRGIF